MEYADAINSFRDFMASKGYATSDEIVGDGTLRRFQVDGDSPGSGNGWYKLHVDERPAGQFGSWKTGEKISWVANTQRKLTAAERRELEKKIGDQKRELESELEILHAEASKRASELWAAAEACSSDHPYLRRKGIKPCGAKIQDGHILIPMRGANAGLWSLQYIAADGSKRFLPDGRVKGCYFTISQGKPRAEGTILLCEGFATGASLHAATDLPVVVAFNAGNLESVARAIRGNYPGARLVICADNDAWTKRPVENPGRHYATRAAQAVGGLLAVPEFRHASDTNRLTDFNDLAGSEGLPRVAEILEGVLAADIVAQQVQELEPASAPLEELEPMQAAPPIPSDSAPAAPSPRLSEIGSHGGLFQYAIADWPITGARGKPVSCIENVRHLLNVNKIKVRYDIIRKCVSVIIPGENYLIDTEKNAKITRLISLASVAGLPRENFVDYIYYVGSQNPYNAVADWVGSKPWDGRSRLAEFFSTVSAVNETEPGVREFKEILMRKWALSACAAAFAPAGVSAHGVLTLQGDQNLGKTAWFKSLVPAELKLIADGKLLDPRDKDSVYQVVTKWLVELGEVDATFRKSDIAQLKAFLTKDHDVLRRPYEREESEFARRTVFFASVNPEDYLNDATGNRRFWTIRCAAINFRHGLDMQQVWAEFYSLYAAGESWYLTPDEVAHLNAHNRDFEAVSAVEELIAEAFSWNDPETLWAPRSATDIAIAIGIREPKEMQLKQVARAIRERTGRARIKTNGKYLYMVPSLRIRDLTIQ